MSYLVSFIIHVIVICLILFFNPLFLKQFNNSSGVGFITLVKSKQEQDNNLDYKTKHLSDYKEKSDIFIQMSFANKNNSNLNDYVLKKGHFTPPSYPEQAIDKKHEGIVVLLVVLDNYNKVKDILLKKTSNYEELDKIAITNAKKHWIGKKIENADTKKITINIKFSLIK